MVLDYSEMSIGLTMIRFAADESHNSCWEMHNSIFCN